MYHDIRKERTSKRRQNMTQPYPLNLLLSVNDDFQYGIPFERDNITQKNLDGLKYVVSLLPEQTRDLLHMRYEEKLSYDQIAEKYGLSRERVRSLAANAERELRRPVWYNYICYGVEKWDEYLVQIQAATQSVREDVMNCKVHDLALWNGESSCLMSAGCKTVYDIVSLTREQILSIDQLCPDSRQRVAQELDRLGIEESVWQEFLFSIEEATSEESQEILSEIEKLTDEDQKIVSRKQFSITATED